MTTMVEIAARAFRKLGISGSGEDLRAEYLVEGVETLNMLLHEWKLSAVDITHTDLEAADDFPLGPEFELGTVYILAGHISPNYEAPAAFDADDFFRRIQAAYMTIDTVTMPNALVYTPSRKARDGTLGPYE